MPGGGILLSIACVALLGGRSRLPPKGHTASIIAEPRVMRSAESGLTEFEQRTGFDYRPQMHLGVQPSLKLGTK